MMIEVAPQVVCMVTNTPVLSGMLVPFSGCISNLTFLQWFDDSFVLSGEQEVGVRTFWQNTPLTIPNWDFNLTKLQHIIEQSEDVQDHIKLLNQSIALHTLATTIVSDKVIKI